MDKLTTRVDRQIAVLLFALAFGLYLRTLAPGLLDGDSGEFQFAAWRLGLAHPTGYPLYLLLGSLWQHSLAWLGISPATALNAFSALIGALAVALLYLVMYNWLIGDVILRRGVAALTAFCFAVNPTFWSQNLIAEVYTLHTFFILLIFYTTQALASIQSAQTEEQTLPPNNSTRPSPPAPHSLSPSLLVPLSFLTGLALTHHGMTLWLLPGLLMALLLIEPAWWRNPRHVFGMLCAGSVPFLLYLYLPLRSGPTASPWYHQHLGAETLDLYTNSWAAFFNFISGRSISVGFYGINEALTHISQAWLLWRLHFTWIELFLIGVGLYTLIRERRWPILALTLTYALIQQLFNLFYAIGDILVYYIPLYLVATLWFGFGVQALLTSIFGDRDTDATRNTSGQALRLVCLTLFFMLPLAVLRQTYPALDQSATNRARTQWKAILAAQPPANAILISNDRNEMVPLFYLQAVEGQATGMTALFPLIKPEPRFADIGATVDAALAAGEQPVYLIKPMPGLGVKFQLKPARDPLVQVLGPSASVSPTHPVNQPFGPLHLVGYNWQAQGDKVQIDLHWSVQAPLAADYTTTVQLFDANEAKITQDDHAPGGVYYPTSLWKPGDILVDSHVLTLPPDRTPTTLLVGMYTGANFEQLATPLKIQLN